MANGADREQDWLVRGGIEPEVYLSSFVLSGDEDLGESVGSQEELCVESGCDECSERGIDQLVYGVGGGTEAIEILRASIDDLVDDERGATGKREAGSFG